MAEHWACKPKVTSSILVGGKFTSRATHQRMNWFHFPSHPWAFSPRGFLVLGAVSVPGVDLVPGDCLAQGEVSVLPPAPGRGPGHAVGSWQKSLSSHRLLGDGVGVGEPWSLLCDARLARLTCGDRVVEAWLRRAVVVAVELKLEP